MSRKRLIVISIAFHVGVVIALVAADLWRVDRLDAPRSHEPLSWRPQVSLQGGGGAPASREPPKVESRPKRVAVRDLVQPVALVRNPVREMTLTYESEGGHGGGIGRGEGRGIGDGTCWGDSCGAGMGGAALTSVLPAPPKVVVDTITSVEMAALRISGETQIEPSLERKQALAAAQRYQLVVDLRVCISDLGAVTSVDVVRSSGFADYDARLVTKARAWRYRPYSLDGVAQPVCAPVRFDYRLTVPMILRR